MIARLTSRSDGRGPALSALVAEWAARNPKIRSVWVCDGAGALAIEPQPVVDSDETLPVWIANCEKWRLELEDRLGRAVDLERFDLDAPRAARTLIYERADWR